MSEPVRVHEPSGTDRPSARLRRVLLIGLRREPIERLVPALRTGAFEVGVAHSGPGALAVCRRQRFDLLLIREPVRELSLEELLEELRASGGLSSRAFVQVLTDEYRIEELAGHTGDRLGVCHWADFPRLLSAVSREVLGVAPRVSKGLMVEVSTQVAGGTVSRFCQVENVSESGILIKTQELISVGESVVVALSLPGAPQLVRVSGEVVRHTEGAETRGFAVSFDAFAGLSLRWLCGYLNA